MSGAGHAPPSAALQGARALDRRPGLLARQWLRLHGHYATLTPFLWRRFFPAHRPLSAPWSVTCHDPDVGDLRLTGSLRALDGDELLVVIHGLGGSARSGYMPLALAAAAQGGVSCLLLNTRGADLSGEDISHAALTADLDAALASPVLAGYRRVYLLGYSLGGHLALRYASERPDERVVAVAAVSSPLDLEASARALDCGWCNVYRSHVLGGLKAIYEARYRKRGGPVPPGQARRIGKIRQWDDVVVAPRFGFSGADEYYAKASVAGRLGGLAVQALYVGATADPMVPRDTVEAALSKASSLLHVHWERRGGHLGFSSQYDLGQPAPRGLEHQVVAWLRAR